MELLSFSLGIAFVAVVAIAAVAVYAFVRVNNLNTQIRDLRQVLHENTDHIYRSISTESGNIFQRINEVQKQTDDIAQDIYRTIDSRCDKLESKLSSSKQILKG